MLTLDSPRPTNPRVAPDAAFVWHNDASVEDAFAREFTQRIRGAELCLLVTEVSGLSAGSVKTELLTIPAPVVSSPSSWYELTALVFGSAQPLTPAERSEFNSINKTYARAVGPLERRARPR